MALVPIGGQLAKVSRVRGFGFGVFKVFSFPGMAFEG